MAVEVDDGRRGVRGMPGRRTGAKVARAASKVPRSGSTWTASKTAAGSAHSQRASSWRRSGEGQLIIESESQEAVGATSWPDARTRAERVTGSSTVILPQRDSARQALERRTGKRGW